MRSVLAMLMLLIVGCSSGKPAPIPNDPPAAKQAVTATQDAKVFATQDGEEIGVLAKGSSAIFSTDAGEFHEIILFSGEPRFVAKSQAQVGQATFTPPSDETGKALFAKLVSAEKQATKDADEAVDPSDIQKWTSHKRILIDRYKLLEANAAKVSPIDIEALELRGVTENWPSN